MRLTAVSALISLSATPALWAQQPAKPLAFEVASIRPAAAGEPGEMIAMKPGGRFVATNVTVSHLIAFAYGMRRHQITGGPNWLNTEHYDVTAKADIEIPPGKKGQAMVREMLVTLLTQRFQLNTRRETREMPIYSLVVAKTGLKMRESGADEKGSRMQVGRSAISGTGIGCAALARQLTDELERNVVDKTGLTAEYDVKLEWTPDVNDGAAPGEKPEAGATPVDGPTLFTALQEQLGLKLEPAKGPVEILVIERAEKAAEN